MKIHNYYKEIIVLKLINKKAMEFV